MALSDYPNLALRVIKWPTAAGAIFMLPGTCMALWSLGGRALTNSAPLTWFAAGFGGYFVLWQLLFRKKLAGSLFSTLEHELTHAIFAWLTLHRVTGLKATWNSGGEMRYRGDGNWLISIAPYWFPTLCVPLLIMGVIGESGTQRWWPIALGATFSYHVLSTWRETHAGQTDLHKTTMLFAWLFLPTANLLSLGCIIAFCHDGVAAAELFVADAWANTWATLGPLMK